MSSANPRRWPLWLRFLVALGLVVGSVFLGSLSWDFHGNSHGHPAARKATTKPIDTPSASTPDHSEEDAAKRLSPEDKKKYNNDTEFYNPPNYKGIPGKNSQLYRQANPCQVITGPMLDRAYKQYNLHFVEVAHTPHQVDDNLHTQQCVYNGIGLDRSSYSTGKEFVLRLVVETTLDNKQHESWTDTKTNVDNLFVVYDQDADQVQCFGGTPQTIQSHKGQVVLSVNITDPDLSFVPGLKKAITAGLARLP